MADSVATKKPTVHIHESTGLKFIRGTKHVLFETGVTVPREEFDRLENGGLAERLGELTQEPQNCNFDFAYGCTTGVLRKKKGAADLVANARTERRRMKEVEAAAVMQKDEAEHLPPNADPPKEQKKAAGLFSSVFLVAVIMAIVGIGSAVMSAYHTSVFLIEGGKPVWTGITTGIMFILFSGTSFTAARYFLQEKGAQKIFGLLFIIAGFAIITYSVFSTLTVNYNQFKWVIDEKTSIAVEDNETLAAHERLLLENREALTEVNKEIERKEEEAGYWRSMSWRRYDEIQGQLAALQERRVTLRQRRVELEAAKPELVAQAESSQETVYTMLARLLKIPEDVARFFVYAAPACLYDILAPFALSIVLLLTDRRRNE